MYMNCMHDMLHVNCKPIHPIVYLSPNIGAVLAATPAQAVGPASGPANMVLWEAISTKPSLPGCEAAPGRLN